MYVDQHTKRQVNIKMPKFTFLLLLFQFYILLPQCYNFSRQPSTDIISPPPPPNRAQTDFQRSNSTALASSAGITVVFQRTSGRMGRERGATEMATPPHVFFSSSRPQTPHGQCIRSCLRQRRLLQPHIKGHSRFVSPLFQNEAECDVRLIVKFWNVENVFSRVWEFTLWLHFGIWVLHHSMLSFVLSYIRCTFQGKVTRRHIFLHLYVSLYFSLAAFCSLPLFALQSRDIIQFVLIFINLACFR